MACWRTDNCCAIISLKCAMTLIGGFDFLCMVVAFLVMLTASLGGATSGDLPDFWEWHVTASYFGLVFLPRFVVYFYYWQRVGTKYWRFAMFWVRVATLVIRIVLGAIVLIIYENYVLVYYEAFLIVFDVYLLAVIRSHAENYEADMRRE